MEYVYPAVFHPNANGSYTITFPDLPGCISEGKSLPNALYMAQAALFDWAEFMEEEGETLPAAAQDRATALEQDEFMNYIRAETKDNRAVRRNISIPRWMDEQVSRRGLSLSRVVQDALTERFSRA
ncbi:MAG: type II toxin-antitoxin system HicB family antitoxin [Firmicutes bacterium]|nr:type II toxin-antitoxin system HicB family antitoxin [Bacillota bacterium]